VASAYAHPGRPHPDLYGRLALAGSCPSPYPQTSADGTHLRMDLGAALPRHGSHRLSPAGYHARNLAGDLALDAHLIRDPLVARSRHTHPAPPVATSKTPGMTLPEASPFVVRFANGTAQTGIRLRIVHKLLRTQIPGELAAESDRDVADVAE